jgi:hypothetical protein
MVQEDRADAGILGSRTEVDGREFPLRIVRDRRRQQFHGSALMIGLL